jgi:dihydrolipoamide dehydrogenase
MGKYDLIVVGGGPGGHTAALHAAKYGIKTLLIEKEKIGGLCLNAGCIPLKAIISSINFLSEIKNASGLGIDVGSVAIDYRKVLDRKNKVVEQRQKGIHFLLKKANIDFKTGSGKLVDDDKVEIAYPDGKKEIFTAKNIILAMGSEPICPKSVQFDGRTFFNTTQIMDLYPLPKKMNIVGGGVIGVHFATIFAELGIETTVIELKDSILPEFDKEICGTFNRILKKKGVKVEANTKFDFTKKDVPTLICIGQKPKVEELAGSKIKTDRSVFVDDYLQTNIKGVYAVGDLTGKMMLAHVASYQARIAVENISGNKIKADYSAVPVAIFTKPEIAFVGYSEDDARAQGIDCEVKKLFYQALGIAQAAGQKDGLFKIIIDKKTKKLIGIHIIGKDACSLIAIGSMAISLGVKADDFVRIIFPHPTFSEGISEAILGWNLRLKSLPAGRQVGSNIKKRELILSFCF